MRVRGMSHVFRQDYVRGPFGDFRVPLGRRLRRWRLHRVRLASVMELVVLVLDPVEFEKVDGQQDDAQEQHEADDQRRGKPSNPHGPRRRPPQPGKRSERIRTRRRRPRVRVARRIGYYTVLRASVTSYGRTGYAVMSAYLLAVRVERRDPRGPEKVGRSTTRRPRSSSFHSRRRRRRQVQRIRILYINIILLLLLAERARDVWKNRVFVFPERVVSYIIVITK